MPQREDDQTPIRPPREPTPLLKDGKGQEVAEPKPSISADAQLLEPPPQGRQLLREAQRPDEARRRVPS